MKVSSLKFTEYLVAKQAFVSEPLTVVDVGARAGFEPHWLFYGDQAKLIGFEPDEKECKRLNKQMFNSGNSIFPVALHQNRGKKTFYITSYHLSSSSFYQPDMEFCKRFPDEANLVVEKTIEIDTIDFDSFANENHISSVDFIKLDTEGSELDILKGAVRSLRKSVIGVSVEVEFLPVHKDQPVFSEVDPFMRQNGFWLFDLSVYRKPRKVLSMSTKPSSWADYGQIIWAQALYLRDGVNEINSSSSLENGWDDIKILKLASIMELFYLSDCAIELIQIAHRKGLLQRWDVSHLLDLLVSSVERKNISYNEYLKNIEHSDKIKRRIRRGKGFF